MNLYQVLLGPIVTEKSVRLQEKNKHSFRVHLKATKIDVMRAIKRFYGVDPIAVNIISQSKKVRFLSRTKVMTKRSRARKAIVTLPEGKSIELVETKKAVPEKKLKNEKKSPS